MSSSKIVSLRVQTQTGKVFDVDVYETDTVKALKELIGKKEGIPIGYQKLYFNGVKLEDKEPLSRYKIKSDDTLILVIPTRGVRAIAPDVTKQEMKKTERNSFHFWKVNDGCNYGGICKIESCKAFQQLVMYSRGFGSINPIDDEHMDEIVRCPGCNEKFEVDGYYFYKCQVEVIYKKCGEKEITKMPVKIVKGKEFWQLGGDQYEKVEYISLRFNVIKLQ